MEYGKIFDTVSVCLSKGLGCPIGSVLIGKDEIMKKSLRIRKVLGDAMRQVGYLASAAIYALDNNLDRLKEDHKRAKELGDELTDKSFVKRVEKVETNIIVFEIDNKIDKQTIINSFNEYGVLFDWYSMGVNKIRLVTHLNYTEKNHIYLLDSIKNLKI